jgi:hypothetical protein
MKNVKLNSDWIIKDVIKGGDFSSDAVEGVIKNLPWHKSLTIVENETEAEEKFKEWFADSEVGAEEYMKPFGGVHSNVIETFNIEIEHDNEIYNFRISISEYYVDSGSVDYMYGVTATLLQ